MPPTQDLDPALQALLLALENHEAVTALASLPAHLINAKVQRSLKIIRRGRTVTNAKGGSPRSGSPRNPFRSIANLTASDLDVDLEYYLQQGVFDVNSLLNGATIEHDIRSTGSTGDDFQQRYTFALDLEEHQNDNNVRMCFVYLFYFDLVRLICPHTTGNKVGDTMRANLGDFLAGTNYPQQDHQKILDKVNTWSRLGSRVNDFCEAFGGNGCIFHLGNVLSHDFIKEKYARSGKYHHEGFTHLHELGLKQQARNSGANDYGQQIRDFMIRPFGGAASRHVTVAPGPAPGT